MTQRKGGRRGGINHTSNPSRPRFWLEHMEKAESIARRGSVVRGRSGGHRDWGGGDTKRVEVQTQSLNSVKSGGRGGDVGGKERKKVLVSKELEYPYTKSNLFGKQRNQME